MKEQEHKYLRVRERDRLEVRSSEAVAITWIIKGTKCWVRLPKGVEARVVKAEKKAEGNAP